MQIGEHAMVNELLTPYISTF